MIAGKFSQKIVDRSVWLRTGSVECKYAPSPIGLAYGYESFANGARCSYPVVETPTVNYGFSRFRLMLRFGSSLRFNYGSGTVALLNGLAADAADQISRRAGMPIAAGPSC